FHRAALRAWVGAEVHQPCARPGADHWLVRPAPLLVGACKGPDRAALRAAGRCVEGCQLMDGVAQLRVEDSPIPGLKVVSLPVHRDERGWFKENWQREKMVAAGLPDFRP